MLNSFAPQARNRTVYLLAALAGAANVFAFAPFGFYFVPVLTVALLLHLVFMATSRRAALIGFCFGAAWFGGGMYWLYISVHEFGKAPIVVAVLLMLGLIAIMALYYALFGWLAARFAPRALALRYLVWAPAAWTLLEWIRGWFLSGFPWFALGYSQTDSLLAGYAPIIGVFGVSLVVMLLAGAAALLAHSSLRSRATGIGVIVVVLIAGGLLERVEWTRSAESTIGVALMQGNFRQDQKWLPENQVPTMQRYWELTQGNADVDLVVWPEAAIPALYDQLDQGYYAQVEEELQPQQRLLTGTLVRDFERRVYYNSAVVLGAPERRFYHKRHLVPFGEYFPVPDFVRRWLRLMNLPYSDFETGDDGSALKVSPELSVAMMICYEAVFGEELITALPEAQLLVNISNDGWFGRSIGPFQHFQIARMRALETGRWLVRATNTGITAIVDERGRVIDRVPQFESVILRGEVELRSGATPYVRFGNWLVAGLAVFLLLTAVTIDRRKQQ